jgi:hypothetical protein
LSPLRNAYHLSAGTQLRRIIIVADKWSRMTLVPPAIAALVVRRTSLDQATIVDAIFGNRSRRRPSGPTLRRGCA